MALPRKQLSRRGALKVRAFEDEEEEIREWPYPNFIAGATPFFVMLWGRRKSRTNFWCDDPVMPSKSSMHHQQTMLHMALQARS